MTTPASKRDLEGNVLVRGKCSVCSKCWIYLGNGACIYGGPYKGYVKEKEDDTNGSSRDRQQASDKSS